MKNSSSYLLCANCEQLMLWVELAHRTTAGEQGVKEQREYPWESKGLK